MADEPQNADTEKTANLAIASQPPANVITVYDRDGRAHFAAPTSKFVIDGLADGTLTEEPPAKTGDDPSDGGQQESSEEVPGGAEAGSAGHDPEPGSADGGDGSGDGPPEAGGSGRRRRAGQA
jgi:hypothetical protein